jgi:nitrite reductase (NO-forming)
MSILRMPANLVMPASTTRRNVLRGAGVGLGLGAANALFGNALAQEHEHGTPAATDGTPPAASNEGNYVGSDAGTAGTGDATPIPGQPIPFEPYNPFMDPVEPGDKHVNIFARDETVFIAKDMPYAGWTFNGTIPGPPIRAVVGDTINVTVHNDAAMTHSVDFHSARVNPEFGYQNVEPGQTFEWSFTAEYPGAYMVHCGTAPVYMHIAAGMYLPMIVDPAPDAVEQFEPAQEIVFSQSEFYVMEGEGGVYVPDTAKLFALGHMDVMGFNGYAHQYVEYPIHVRAGELVRIYIVNMGPNVWTSFHVVGAIFSKAYLNANPKNVLEGLQGLSIGPGDGACVEFTLDEPGTYIAVNHAFGHAAHGAQALIVAE